MENKDSKFNDVPVPKRNPFITAFVLVWQGTILLALTFLISGAVGGATYMAINGFEFGYSVLEDLLRNVG